MVETECMHMRLMTNLIMIGLSMSMCIRLLCVITLNLNSLIVVLLALINVYVIFENV